MRNRGARAHRDENNCPGREAARESARMLASGAHGPSLAGQGRAGDGPGWYGLIALGALLLLMSGVNPVLANADENDKIGFSSNHIFESTIEGENVDVMTGNLNLRIPIGQRFQLNDWFGYELALYYNSKIWRHRCESEEENETWEPGDPCIGELASDLHGVGWLFHLGRIYRHPDDRNGFYRYQEPSGAEHSFCWPVFESECLLDDSGTGAPLTIGAGRAFDNSGYRFEETENGWIVTPGNGTRIVLERDFTGADAWQGWYTTSIQTMAELAGQPQQWVNITYHPQSTEPTFGQITDSAGRQIDFNSNNSTITFPGPGGTTRVYDITFESLQIQDPQYLQETGGASELRPTVKTLKEIILPSVAVDADTQTTERYKHVFSYALDASMPSLGGYPFGYLQRWTLPAGAETRYLYKHYKSVENAPLHSEIAYKELTVDPGDPESDVLRWSYTRYGGLIRTDADLQAQFSGGAQNPIRSNTSSVRVLDPLDNLTVYNFHYTIYQGSRCNGCGCKGEWDDGLLSRVRTYAGSEIDPSRLIRDETRDYIYDGRTVHLEPNDCTSVYPGGPLGTPLKVRSAGNETTYYGGNPIRSHRVELGAWTNLQENGFYDYNSVAKAREVKEYDGTELVRTTYTNYQPTDEFQGNHDHTVTYDSSGTPVVRTDKVFVGNRLAKSCLRLDPSTSSPCDEATLAVGDVMVELAYDVAGSLSERVTRGGDDGGEVKVTYVHDNGVLKQRQFDGMAWKAIEREVDSGTGQIESSTDPAGIVTTYQWDELGRLLSINPPSPEASTRISYPSLNRTVVTNKVGTTAEYTEQEYLYDNLGRVLEEHRWNLDGDATTPDSVVRQSEYDLAGNLVRQSDWARLPVETPVWTEYKHELTFSGSSGPETFTDPLGRLTRTLLPDGTVRETKYEGQNVRQIQTDIAGANGTRITSETLLQNDALGRLVAVDSPGGGADATYVYDALDRLTEVHLTDGQTVQTRRFFYDALGRLRRAQHPENGMTEYTTYDPTGKLLGYVDSRQNEFLMEYDAAGRLLRRSWVGATTELLAENFYDSQTGRLAFRKSYQLQGSESEGVSTVSYTYGPSGGTACPVDPVAGSAVYQGLNGRVSVVSIDIDGFTQSTQHCYHPSGAETLTVYPGAATAVSRVLQHGQELSIGDPIRDKTYLATIDRDSTGRPTTLRRPNSILDEIERDLMGRPYRFTILSPNGNSTPALTPPPADELYDCPDWDQPGRLFIPEFCPELPDPPTQIPENTEWSEGPYAYDGAGNIEAIGNSLYEYDELGRLIWARPEIDPGYYHTMTYGYDAFGNMTLRHKLAGGADITQNFTVDPNTNRLVSEQRVNTFGQVFADLTYQYDDGGNLTSDGETAYAFNPENRLTEVWNDDGEQVARSWYDASGYRVRRIAEGTETFYFRDDAGQLLTEYSRQAPNPNDPGSANDPVWSRDYIYGAGQILSMIQNVVPEAPGRVWATEVTPNHIKLNWDAVDVPDLDRYEVTKIVTNPTYWPVEDVTWKEFDSLVALTSVTFEVRAVDTANHKSPPAIIVVEPGSSPPDPPTGLVGTPGDRQVSLSWQWSQDPMPEDFWGFIIERRPASGGLWAALNELAVTNTAYLDFNLTNGDAYEYQVRAVDTAGNQSDPADPITLTPQDLVPPDTPTGFKVQPDPESPNVLRAFWNESFAPDTAGYLLRGTPPSGPPTEATCGVGCSTAELGSLVASWEYEVELFAYDDDGNYSSPTPLVTVSTRESLSYVPTPVGSSAEFVVDPNEEEDLQLYPNGHCEKPPVTFIDTENNNTVVTGSFQPACYNNDIRAVRLEWSEPSMSGPGPWGYRIYRAPASDEAFETVADVESTEACDGTCHYVDTTAVATEYVYYVVTLREVSSQLLEGVADAVHSVTDTFDSDDDVALVVAHDGGGFYPTLNSRGRRVSLEWTKVPHPGVQGYNVYRRCSWDQCRDSGRGVKVNSLRTADCVPTWHRLNEEPVVGAYGYVDESLNGLGGCWEYAVRVIGPDGEEGGLGRAVRAILYWNYDGSDGYYPRTQTAGIFSIEPRTKVHWYYGEEISHMWGIQEHEKNRVGEVERGTGSSAGPPAAPDVYDFNEQSCYLSAAFPGHYNPGYLPNYYHFSGYTHWRNGIECPGGGFDENDAIRDYASYGPQRQLEFEDLAGVVTWHPNTESDLLGYHVEMATAENGPWRRLTSHPLAWWETRFDARLWIDDRFNDVPEEYVGPRCALFRVIAVDRWGLESEPSDVESIGPYSQDVPGGPYADGCVAPLDGPHSPADLAAETVPWPSQPTTNTTKLTWTHPINEVPNYRVYRFTTANPLEDRHYRFFVASYYDEELESGNLPVCTVNADNDGYDCSYVETATRCPWDDCDPDQLNAFYVVALDENGNEGLPSNVVLWDPTDPIGYAQAVPVVDEAQETVAYVELSKEAEVAAKRSPADNALAIAPLATLGQSAPAYEILNVHVDHLGSTRFVTDEEGWDVSEHDYLPFGEEVQEQLTYGTKRFTGHERDRETGLNYMLARYHGSQVPRFSSPDPRSPIDQQFHDPVLFANSLADSQSWNRYSYVLNSPLYYFDPTGEAAVATVWGRLGAAAASAGGSAAIDGPVPLGDIVALGILAGWAINETSIYMEKTREKGISKLFDRIDEHFDKISGSPPGPGWDPTRGAWKKEIKKFIREIEKKMRRVKNRVKKAEWQRRLDEARDKLTDSQGGAGAKPNSYGIDPDGAFGPMTDPCVGRGPSCQSAS